MGTSAGGSADLPASVVAELRRSAAELLEDVSSYADDMLDYILGRIPEAGADDDLRGLTLGSCSSHLEAAVSATSRHPTPSPHRPREPDGPMAPVPRTPADARTDQDR